MEEQVKQLIEEEVRKEVEEALKGLTICFDYSFLQKNIVLKLNGKEISRTQVPVF